MSVRVVSMILFLALVGTNVEAQLFRAETKVPNAEVLSAARKLAEKVFADLEKGDTDSIAAWISSELFFHQSEINQKQKRDEFKSKLELLAIGPPAGFYGKIDGYDLLDEAYLPGSDRYFRFVYVSYHQAAPLMWEFRFYVKPGNKLALNYITWEPANPFEYLATGDMRLPHWNQ